MEHCMEITQASLKERLGLQLAGESSKLRLPWCSIAVGERSPWQP